MNPTTVHDVLARIETLFLSHGRRPCAEAGEPHRSVTALQHALQCAQLAEWAEADDALVVAALLHDIGHFFHHEVAIGGVPHEERALPWLMAVFPPAVTEPVRLHVAARRYLVSVDARYAEQLSPAAVYKLARQGGAMDATEVRHFEALPYARDAVQLRLWDDLARHPGQHTPPLAHYLRLIARLLGDTPGQQPTRADRGHRTAGDHLHAA